MPSWNSVEVWEEVSSGVPIESNGSCREEHYLGLLLEQLRELGAGHDGRLLGSCRGLLISICD